MHSQTAVVVGRSRPTVGPASVTQGVYGARGNLELVACDRSDGLWVFWFNSDLASDPLETPDVPPGSWSDGLHFAAGHRYRDVCILQSTLGPDHLEVIALTENGDLQSWYWSPGPGFTRRTADVETGVVAFDAEHDDGRITVHLSLRDGSTLTRRSTGAAYPERSWERVDGEGIGGIGDRPTQARLAEAGVEDAEPGSARSARSTRNGGTTELVWRGSDGLVRHLGVPDSSS
ncbi:hypothetical protein [Agromyces marinus]|uniref:Uncharacterized protein n=1 Tax=Agromyces marinus TaxID=1389020 RepID=A0ABM8H0Z8_9MICO|nr:hypothetical protein [Agromyces marinus]BDZ54455.1 hypothetical protein GCM10025870_15280 [Agromyces marinus]